MNRGRKHRLPFQKCTDELRVCQHPDNNCLNDSSDCTSIDVTIKGAFLCTREIGHEGPHVACCRDKHNYMVWTDAEILQKYDSKS